MIGLIEFYSQVVFFFYFEIFKFLIRCSTVTDSTAMSSRYHGRNRPRRRKHRLPSGLDRVNFFFFKLFIIYLLSI